MMDQGHPDDHQPPAPGPILVVDEDLATSRAIAGVLSTHGFETHCATSTNAAIRLAGRYPYPIVIVAPSIPAPSGPPLVDLLALINPRSRFILLTNAADTDLTAGYAHRSAVSSVIQKPWDDDELVATIRQMLEIDLRQSREETGRAPCTALLVEDNPGDSDLVCEYLAGTGNFQVECVQRLDDALTILAQRSVDVVLTDLSLPDAAGLDTVRRMVRKTPETALIVLSGIADEDLALQAVQSGAQDYLIQDQMTAPLLRRAIRNARERKGTEQQACPSGPL